MRNDGSFLFERDLWKQIFIIILYTHTHTHTCTHTHTHTHTQGLKQSSVAAKTETSGIRKFY